MKRHNNRRAFAFADLLLALCILFLLGLVVLIVTRVFVGPIAWYWWPVGILGPIILIVAFGMIKDWLSERFYKVK